MPTTVRVTWTPNPPEQQVTAYNIYESVNAGGWTFKAATSLPIFEVLNPLPGVYAYKVAAQNLAGVSPQSDPGSTPPIPTKPETPTVTVIVS
jgi:hypothetical protein